jgi:hypothetical protein
VLAEAQAERAVELTKGVNSGLLDTLARVQFRLGKKTEAVMTEEKAVKVEQDPSYLKDFQKALASYREGKLPDVGS